MTHYRPHLTLLCYRLRVLTTQRITTHNVWWMLSLISAKTRKNNPRRGGCSWVSSFYPCKKSQWRTMSFCVSYLRQACLPAGQGMHTRLFARGVDTRKSLALLGFPKQMDFFPLECGMRPLLVGIKKKTKRRDLDKHIPPQLKDHPSQLPSSDSTPPQLKHKS